MDVSANGYKPISREISQAMEDAAQKDLEQRLGTARRPVDGQVDGLIDGWSLIIHKMGRRRRISIKLSTFTIHPYDDSSLLVYD